MNLFTVFQHGLNILTEDNQHVTQASHLGGQLFQAWCEVITHLVTDEHERKLAGELLHGQRMFR
ncbi:hypothetical protein D3C85_1418710 [compost metagenome]